MTKEDRRRYGTSSPVVQAKGETSHRQHEYEVIEEPSTLVWGSVAMIESPYVRRRNQKHGVIGIGSMRRLCPAGRKTGSKCPRFSRITASITEVAGFDVQAERKVCGRHSGACNGYPQCTIGMPSVSAHFTHVGDNHRV
ncbi:hypothetical protein LF1_57320 [Rubripirellula obstinata]|uniref:Uncharacterized protein n=1 Tax=Rubripirellula obstinata TaxID=406547 RepID=A0A5B1C8Y2_9BACT|nr:hypothetical protein [Rubripirellula obstinata]KAA1256986.1 hypothetical protein LF1_57320 [Rubripirellula obstinata]